MKRFSPLLALVVTLCASPGLLAQVELSCKVRYKEYILFEPILVTLYVKNTGPRPIELYGHGEGIPGPAPAPAPVPARLSFEIKNSRGYSIDRKEFENIQGLLQALKIADLPRADLEKALEGLRAIQKRNKGVKHTPAVRAQSLAAERALNRANRPFKLTVKQLNDPLGKEPVPLLKKPVIVPPQATLPLVQFFDINTAYLVNKVGSYRMSAVVQIGNIHYTEPRHFIEVYHGIELRKLTNREDGRVWSLRKQSRPPRIGDEGNSGIFLFLRVDDGNGRINFGVHTLGRMIDAFEPLLILDPLFQIRVVHRHSPKVFMEHFYTDKGKFIKRIEYARGFGPVVYGPDENKPGKIRVNGLRPLRPLKP
jgi:hypothetical protein